jgi:two-component system sensor histidine kinase HydH
LQEPRHQPESRRAGSDGHDRRSVAELAELAGGLAHELRNPLSTMKINLKLLAEDLQAGDANFEDVRRRALLKVETLRREAERLESLFEDFLNLTGPCGLSLEEADLREIVDRLAEFLDPMMKNSAVHLEVIQPGVPVTCRVDAKLLSQGLLNIALNAREAMPEGGLLRVETGLDGEWAFIRMTDTGMGIAPTDLDRIMRPFFSTKADGSGLGLSVTRRIVNEHGGTIAFSSERGKGTQVTVRLPRQTPDSGPVLPG